MLYAMIFIKLEIVVLSKRYFTISIWGFSYNLFVDATIFLEGKLSGFDTRFNTMLDNVTVF